MRRLAWVTAGLLLTGAAPALADDNWRDDRRDRYEDRRDRYEDRWDRREDRWDDNRHRGNWGASTFNRNDPWVRHWAFRHYDHNRNGKLGDREWSQARQGFYRFADRNRDGYLNPRELSWANARLRDAYRW